MSNWAVFSDERVQTIIHSIPPHTVFLDWPTTTVPPGVLVLLMERTSAVRQWASAQASRYSPSPLPAEKFTVGYVHTFEIITQALVSRDSSGARSIPTPRYQFTTDTFNLWAGFSTALRFIPVEFLKANSRSQVDVRKVVTGHLGDTDIHFVEVLRCFNFLLKRLDSSFWVNEPPEYPLMVFDAVKNNTAFAKLIQSTQNNKDEKPWHLAWVHEYFRCVQKMEQIYSAVVAKISDFLLEELQHERFGDARPYVLNSATRHSALFIYLLEGKVGA
ncbi:hypothetical protein AN958_07624 [Leucoagaricus sp. SymC.cos]|nr:hypothetical protein AN958_07624 [Leucoagaricus sp. SymC.cos]